MKLSLISKFTNDSIYHKRYVFKQEAAPACPSLFVSKCRNVGNHMSRLDYDVVFVSFHNPSAKLFEHEGWSWQTLKRGVLCVIRTV